MRGSGCSQLVVDLEPEVVRALLGLEVAGAELLVSADGPMVVNLVLNLHLGAIVGVPPQGGLQVGVVRELVAGGSLCAERGVVETLGTFGSVVGHLKGMLSTVAVVVVVADGHEVLLHVETEEVVVLGILGGEGNLGPQAGEVLGIVLEVDTSVVLVLMSEADVRLDLGLLFVVVLDVVLQNVALIKSYPGRE